MMHSIRFQAATFTLSCTYLLRMFFPDPDDDPCPNRELSTLIIMCVGQGREVGTIELVAWPSGGNTKSTQDVTQEPKLFSVNSSSDIQVFSERRNITSENVQNSNLEVEIQMTDSFISLLGVFLLVITVLVDAAELQPSRRLRGYASPTVNVGSDAPVRIVFKEPTPARTSSPYFEVQWLMTTMATIPHFMVRKGAFQEAVIMVELDGVRLATGFLSEIPFGAGMTNVGSNVSVS